jgi:2-dehydro-3-deoxyphosphogluconate aldolase/(4S)-4-hydroxy-2-oxoglutarate aldolase
MIQGSDERADGDDGPGSDPGFLSPDVEVCKKVIQACANGGAKCIEFTNRGDFASHVFY